MTDFNSDIYTKEIKNLLDEVFSVYGQFSAWKLRDLTHEELPWKQAYKRKDKVISQDELKDYFKTLLT